MFNLEVADPQTVKAAVGQTKSLGSGARLSIVVTPAGDPELAFYTTDNKLVVKDSVANLGAAMGLKEAADFLARYARANVDVLAINDWATPVVNDADDGYIRDENGNII